MNDFSKNDITYIEGFSAGCDFMVNEIKLWIKSRQFEPRISGPAQMLLDHLTREGLNEGRDVPAQS